MTDTSTNERRPPLHAFEPVHRKATWWLAAIAGIAALLLAAPAISRAEESNPNNDNCLGSIAAGQPEAGSEEQQVKYTFYCNGPITGYQLQAQVPLTGISEPAAGHEHPGWDRADGHLLVLRGSPGYRAQLRRRGQGRL